MQTLKDEKFQCHQDNKKKNLRFGHMRIDPRTIGRKRRSLWNTCCSLITWKTKATNPETKKQSNNSFVRTTATTKKTDWELFFSCDFHFSRTD